MIAAKRHFAALRLALGAIARKRPVTRADCLVTCAGRLRCEASIDVLDTENPITIEVHGGLFPVVIHACDVPVALDALRRFTNLNPNLNRLFAFHKEFP